MPGSRAWLGRLVVSACLLSPALAVIADTGPRARDLGIPFDGVPGRWNAITDVPGVTVGHVTLIEDLPDGRAVRTGVTAILPRGPESIRAHAFAGWFSLAGNGEMTGTTWLEESGFLEGPVMITNTHSVGAVHEGVIRWRVTQGPADHTDAWWSLPVVAETWDGTLNDMNGQHVRPEHAMQALDAARSGPVPEGSVGGGTGMVCHSFKCGIGTSSRIASIDGEDYVVGVLVQANYGSWRQLRVAGVPVGRFLSEADVLADGFEFEPGPSSIIIVVATDAPLLPHQLERVARRPALGLARNGSIASNSSGDIFIAFSTANEEAGRGIAEAGIRMIPNDSIDPVYAATIDATEEAIINALVAGRSMEGNAGSIVRGIDHAKLRSILKRHNRLEDRR
jgi:D-aminopeptidase